MEAILHAFGVNWKLLFIQLLNIGVLVFLFKRYVYPPLFRMMEERQRTIAKGLADAEASARERVELSDAREGIIRDARKDGDALIRELRSRAQVDATKIVDDAQMKAGAIVHEAQAAGQRAKNEIVESAKEDLARLAVKAAEKVLRERKA